MKKIPFLTMNDYKKSVSNISIDDRQLNENFFLHSHSFCEFEIILNGKGTQILNNTKYPLQRGTVAFLAPTDVHEILINEPIHNHNISFELSSISPALMYQLLNTDKKVLYLDEDNFKRIVILSTLLNDAFNNIESLGNEFLKSVLSALVTLYVELINDNSNIILTKPIQKAVLYVHTNFDKKISLNTVASHVHLSANYFSELFSQEVGVPFSQYLRKARIEEAKKLLSTTDRSVTDICFECGFTSLSNFLRAFKSTVDMSPLQYRNLFKHAKKRSTTQRKN